MVGVTLDAEPSENLIPRIVSKLLYGSFLVRFNISLCSCAVAGNKSFDRYFFFFFFFYLFLSYFFFLNRETNFHSLLYRILKEQKNQVIKRFEFKLLAKQ